MHLVQLLLPRYDETVARELTERFGGMTAYARAPAKANGSRRQAKPCTTTSWCTR